MSIHAVLPARTRRTSRKRVGRGLGSGLGKTSGRGHKGQNARAGHRRRQLFEGGQTPLFRRIPKRGFNHARFAAQYHVINILDLGRFDAGAIVDTASCIEKGFLSKKDARIKLLGDGDISAPLTVKVHAVSQSAREKIIRAGGAVELLP